MKKIVPKELYNSYKEEIDILKDNSIILIWEVLNKAKVVGKEIYGNKFSIKKLSEDMDLRYPFVKKIFLLNDLSEKEFESLVRKKIKVKELLDGKTL